MSNKSRLQANNTNLQALITKANNLPDAGGGTGGGSIETCYVQINCFAPAMDESVATYTNANMESATRTFAIMDGARIELAKGTILTLSPWTGTDRINGECTRLFSSITGGAYIISGESTITYG